ncbi:MULTISPECIES: PD40 domain-containing protein [Flavobacteriaceae]|uniref:PD40 domain-containing protein n=1 Tax=Flavobacteriaceae TaxID=49546 RepID=UPI001490D7DA|nr:MULTISPECIES: PD40 domain-containing protein [Allomuricauda]MDC6366833.1 PD40 domain-containing protein [Muricauda sp. AC10]
MYKYISIFTMALWVSSCSHSKKQVLTNEVQYENPFQAMDSIGEIPVMFYPNVVSTAIDKFNTSFSPDGKTIYYTATSQKLGITGIAYQKFEKGAFSQPEFVPFVSHDVPIADVQISPDGNRLLFSTYKDYHGKPKGFNFNLWQSMLIGGVWQDPTPLGDPIDSTGNEFYPVLTASGTLYFNSDKTGNSDLYYAKFTNGAYEVPTPLPKNINSQNKEADAFIAQDESFMIFVRVDEPDGFGNSDLYISFNKGENKWTDPINMGETINSDQIDGSPYVTPDNKYLIFTTGRKNSEIKEEAMESYKKFRSVLASSDNGSLNFYAVKLNLERYRKLTSIN